MKERLQQIRDAWRQLREIDARAVPFVVGALVLGAGAGAAVGSLFAIWAMAVFGLLFAFVAGLGVFNWRLQKAQYAALDGQLGAGAAILQVLRGQWFVSPAVAVNAKQDMVHRAVGRCGIVLVGEGAPARVSGLIAKERKRLERVVGDVPIHQVIVGEGEGQVRLRKLQRHVMKLRGKLGKRDVPQLARKLQSLDKAPPIPKGIDPMALAGRKRPKPR
ncbi:MAG: DUF4191 domain-containing protein [Nitriliruptoraceae bacterium]